MAYRATAPAEGGIVHLIGASLAVPRLCEIYVDVLFLSERDQLLQAFFAADARLLLDAEGRAKEMLAGVVDPDKARFDGHCGAMRGRDVVAPNRRRQSILDGIDLID